MSQRPHPTAEQQLNINKQGMGQSTFLDQHTCYGFPTKSLRDLMPLHPIPNDVMGSHRDFIGGIGQQLL